MPASGGQMRPELDIRFTLMDLPFDVESALRLPGNTIVTIPVEASLAMDIAGNFLTRTASRSTELLGHLKAHLPMGTLQPSAEERFSRKAAFKIQIIRGEGDMVSAEGDVSGHQYFTRTSWFREFCERPLYISSGEPVDSSTRLQASLGPSRQTNQRCQRCP